MDQSQLIKAINNDGGSANASGESVTAYWQSAKQNVPGRFVPTAYSATGWEYRSGPN